MLYGFLGFTPQPDGVRIEPRLPTSWPQLTVTRIAVHDSVLDVATLPNALKINCRKASAKPLQVSLAPGQWQLVITAANAQPVGVAPAHLVKTKNDPISLSLGIGLQAKFTRQSMPIQGEHIRSRMLFSTPSSKTSSSHRGGRHR